MNENHLQLHQLRQRDLEQAADEARLLREVRQAQAEGGSLWNLVQQLFARGE